MRKFIEVTTKSYGDKIMINPQDISYFDELYGIVSIHFKNNKTVQCRESYEKVKKMLEE